MTRLAFGAKCGKLGNPPVECLASAPKSVSGSKLARPSTPRPRDARPKNCRRVRMRGSANKAFAFIVSKWRRLIDKHTQPSDGGKLHFKHRLHRFVWTQDNWRVSNK